MASKSLLNPMFFFFFLLPALLIIQESSSVNAFSSAEYRDALSKSILFYEGMRSGKLPPEQRMHWRCDSGLTDGHFQNVDLTGGYYDSGDNIKFGFPMAFTTTMLSWSIIEYGSQLSKAGELGHAQAAVKWATDYFLKAYTSPTELWVQVGDPNSDHQCWERPEDMDTPRTAYKVTAENPGSDVASETAAALAAASMVFRQCDPSYSNRLLQTARQMFEFADKFRGSYSDVLRSAVSPFYTSYSGFQDELLWGAAWLYKASRDGKYLQYIYTNGDSLGGPTRSFNALSWDNKYAGVDILLTQAFVFGKQNKLGVYKGRADDYICSILPGKGQITPGGLIYHDGATNMQYVTTAAFLLFTYSNYLAKSSQTVSCGGTNLGAAQLSAFAKKQVDYILGENPSKMSYMVGFGSNFPRRVHHRGSSLPSFKESNAHIACSEGFTWFHTNDPNPNLLIGAVVGGPDMSDRYSDERSRYTEAEPATYINSGLVGALALLSSCSS